MEETALQPAPQPPRSRHHWGPLLTVLFVLAVVFWLRRPIPPKEFRALKDYTGALTVSHQEAVLDAKLTGSTARYILDLLQDSQFKRKGDQPPADFAGDLTLRFGEDAVMVFAKAHKKTDVLVTAGESTGWYQIKGDLYNQITGLVYESFPDGVQSLEPQTWWEQYLGLATAGLLENDFKSPKEIPVAAVVDYTYAQILASGKADEYATIHDGRSVYAVPYDLFLRLARRYFAEGASASLKQSSYYNQAANCFYFPTNQVNPLFHYGEYEDPHQNNGYRLVSVTRDQSGNLIALFEDYNRLGFQEQGTLTKLHYLTLLPTGNGEYRFLSHRSELADPSPVSAEGYFTGLSTVAGFTAEDAYTSDLGDGTDFGGDFLLHTIRYEKGGVTLDLYLVDAEYGSRIASHSLTYENSKTIFREVRVAQDEKGSRVIVKTNQEVVVLNEQLEEVKRISLPSGTSFDANGYDISSDLTKLVYTDNWGVQLRDLATNTTVTLTEHPSRTGRPTEVSPLYLLQGHDPETETLLFRRPTFVKGGEGLVVSLVGEDTVQSYIYFDLTKEEPVPFRLPIDPVGDGFEEIQDDKLLITKYPEADQGDHAATEHVVYYFDGSPVDGTFIRQFALDYDPQAPTRYLQGDYLYCFQPVEQPDREEDHFYQLRRIDLRMVVQEDLPVVVQNASPDILAVNGEGRVLFSYRSPAGAGFGVTHADQAIQP